MQIYAYMIKLCLWNVLLYEFLFVGIVNCLGSSIELLLVLLVTAVCQDSDVLRGTMTSAVDQFRIRKNR